MSESPAISVLLAGNGLEETAVVRRHLRRQTVATQVELILVLPENAEAEGPWAWRGLWGGQIVRVPRIASRGQANAAGALAARAPVVALAEDHAYPAADWKEALLEDHQGPWAAVGLRVLKANPGTLVSWADFVVG